MRHAMRLVFPEPFSSLFNTHMPKYNNSTNLPGPHTHGGCSTRQCPLYRIVNTYWDVTCVRVLILCVCVANKPRGGVPASQQMDA